MYLKCIALSETLTAENGNEYKIAAFQELSNYAQLPSGTFEVKSNAKPAKRTIWKGQDGLFDVLEVGNVTGGSIKKFDVEKYTITPTTEGAEPREVAVFTGVQFTGEIDSVTAKRYGHKLSEEAGNVVEAEVNKQVVTAEFAVEA